MILSRVQRNSRQFFAPSDTEPVSTQESGLPRNGGAGNPVSYRGFATAYLWEDIWARDSVLDAWHITLHHLQGNRTHHYVLLIDGQPTYDKTCDGLAVPHGVDEERFAFPTERGPRVFMLFAQTK